MKLNGTFFDFFSTDKLILHGLLAKTASRNKKLLIFIHGMGGSFYSSKLVAVLVAGLKNSGYDLMSINTRGHGTVSRLKTSKGARVLGGTAHEVFKDCIFDIKGAIKQAKEFGYKEFVLAGHSTGCQKITYFQHQVRAANVKAVILLAPADDYNIDLAEKGRLRMEKAVRIAKAMVKAGYGNMPVPSWISNFSARRYLSIADKKSLEASVFNYTSSLKIFSTLKLPVLAVFGTDEVPCGMSSEHMLDLLHVKTNARLFMSALINKADHSFSGKEKEMVLAVKSFLKKL
ncbi:MAG: alpha/beta fold hydrolase [Deltaproteobacteria bacterium]|nr:alpha/beta fold hydrolase [Deltaproteobacteria bacterium]